MSNRKRRRGRAGLLAILLIAGAGGAGYYYWQQEATASSAPMALSTVEVRRGDVGRTVLASGVLEASRLVSVGAQVTGIVEILNATLGEDVVAGEVLAEIDRLQQEHGLRSAQAALARLQAQEQAQGANRGQAEQAYRRALDLRERGINTEIDVEAAALALELADAQLAELAAQIEQAVITIEEAELALTRTRITAPISGTVVATMVEEGQTISVQSSAPTVVKIADLDVMRIKAEISEADVISVRPGQQVWFSILGDPGTMIQAELAFVEPAPPSITSDTGVNTDGAIYYNAIFEVPNPDHRLRIGMTAQVTVVLEQASDVLVVPSGAVRRDRDGGATVEIAQADGTVARVPVETGLDNDILVEILSGLEEGQRVVSAGGAARAAFPAGGPPGGAMAGGAMAGGPPRFGGG